MNDGLFHLFDCVCCCICKTLYNIMDLNGIFLIKEVMCRALFPSFRHILFLLVYRIMYILIIWFVVIIMLFCIYEMLFGKLREFIFY